MHQNKFFTGYNSATKDIVPNTMFRWRSDTVDAMWVAFGDNWEEEKTYLCIKECEVLIHESYKS